MVFISQLLTVTISTKTRSWIFGTDAPILDRKIQSEYGASMKKIFPLMARFPL